MRPTRLLIVDEITVAMLLNILEEHKERLVAKSQKAPLHHEDREYMHELNEMIDMLEYPGGDRLEADLG